MKLFLERSMSYDEYIRLIDDLLLQDKTTGPNQSAAMLNYAKLNRQRMRRLDKTVVIDPSVAFAAKASKKKVIWLILTEGWCGDAAQNVPVIEKIASQSVNITTRYILRDDNLELMDRFLTNGARSIPKLIALDPETLEVKYTWGPRPVGAQELFEGLKYDGSEKPAIMEQLQRWYNADGSHSLQQEFLHLIEQGEGEQIFVTRG